MTDTAIRPVGGALGHRRPSAATILNGSVYILLAVVVVIGIISSEQFRTVDNLVNVMRSIALIGVAALGMNFVIIGGSLVDLSVAATVSVAAVVTLSLSGVSPIAALMVAIAVALLIGLANGVLIRRFRANPILLTLATTTIVGGLLLVATSGQVTYESGSALGHFANARVLGIPVTVLLLILLTVACQLVLSKTTWGHRLLAVGGNEHTAQFSGISVGRMRMQAFIACAGFAGLAGFLLGSSSGAATPTVGAGYEFDALTAAIVGGTRLTGGRGTAYGVFAGALLVGVLSNLLVLWGAPFAFQQVVKGTLLVIVVALGQMVGGNRND